MRRRSNLSAGLRLERVASCNQSLNKYTKIAKGDVFTHNEKTDVKSQIYVITQKLKRSGSFGEGIITSTLASLSSFLWSVWYSSSLVLQQSIVICKGAKRKKVTPIQKHRITKTKASSELTDSYKCWKYMFSNPPKKNGKRKRRWPIYLGCHYNQSIK